MKTILRLAALPGLLLGLAIPAFAADTPPAWGKAADNKIYAQQLVNELMAKYPELVVVGLHLTAPGAKAETMIANLLSRSKYGSLAQWIRVLVFETSGFGVRVSGLPPSIKWMSQPLLYK